MEGDSEYVGAAVLSRPKRTAGDGCPYGIARTWDKNWDVRGDVGIAPYEKART